MKLSQVAAQLYTCRDALGDAAGVAKAVRRLREIGYTAVEGACLGAVTYGEFRRILDDCGMICCSMHEDGNEILGAPERVVERIGALGCRFAVYPFPAGIDLSRRSSVDAWIGKLQRAAEVFERAGLGLCYHNHNHEFRKVEGRVILELIYAGAPAIRGELDTYWIQYGGGDVVEWCGKLAGRFPVMHLKDYQTTGKNEPLWCEIGAGVLDFGRIVAAADKAGCEWFVVEQDTCPGDPFDSLAESFRFVRENLVG